MDETVATARLPGLDIEIRRRRAEDGAAEVVAIAIRAAPGLAAAAEALAPRLLAAGPFWPMMVWWDVAQAMSRAFMPWLALPAPADKDER